MVHTPVHTYTSQLCFPEDATAAVAAADPYRRRGLPDTTHATDEILPTGGHPAVLDLRRDLDGHVALSCLVLPDPQTADQA